MNLKNLTLILTNQCNYRCHYCFQQRDNKTISRETIDKAVDYFYPFFQESGENHIGFYGGEPLLAYDQLTFAVEKIREKTKEKEKQFTFTVTTNGSLLDPPKLAYFNDNKFNLVLSFDGKAQDLGRKEGTHGPMTERIKRMKEYPEINAEINSVFTPRTVGDMFEVLRGIISLQDPTATPVTPITYHLSSMETWTPEDLEILQTQIRLLMDYLLLYYKKNGSIPITNFRPAHPSPGIFHCSAGADRMAVAPGGEVWGCMLFHDYFKTRRHSAEYNDYAYGTLDRLTGNSQSRQPEVSANYAELKQDFYRVGEDHCFLCAHLEGCMICPVNAAYSSGELGKVSPHHCMLVCYQRKFRDEFNRRLTAS